MKKIRIILGISIVVLIVLIISLFIYARTLNKNNGNADQITEPYTMEKSETEALEGKLYPNNFTEFYFKYKGKINTNEIYNHFSGYLYERICWFVRDKNAVANINISSRGENLTKANLINFLKKNNEKFKIDYNKIKTIKIYPNSQKKLLQLADCCCSALGQALKYNDEKHHNYILYLKDKFYMYRKKYLGYGLKYVPGNIEYSKEFNDLIIYLDK